MPLNVVPVGIAQVMVVEEEDGLYRKAFVPIDVTEDGMVTEVSLLR